MFRQKFAAGIALAFALVIGVQTNVLAFGRVKNQKTFKVRSENISATDGVVTEGGAKYPFALSPGLFVVNHRKNYFFDEGSKADTALETQAEDGNPELLSKKYLTKVGGVFMGIFNTPVGSDKASPILPGAWPGPAPAHRVDRGPALRTVTVAVDEAGPGVGVAHQGVHAAAPELAQLLAVLRIVPWAALRTRPLVVGPHHGFVMGGAHHYAVFIGENHILNIVIREGVVPHSGP